MKKGKYHEVLTNGSRRAVYIDGVRTPFVKSFGQFGDSDSLELFSRAVDGLMRRLNLNDADLDEIACGAVIPQTKNGNVARDAILNLGLGAHIHGYTINRACASGAHTIADAARNIGCGNPFMILAGGVECMSDVPIVYQDKARKFLVKLGRARSLPEKLAALKMFSAKAWLPKPPGLTEPKTGMSMGQHAEAMARKCEISRLEQDAFALSSHVKAAAAQEHGIFAKEIIPVWAGPRHSVCADKDNAIRGDTTIESLAKLRPAFDKRYGTITAGTSSGLSDGAAVALIADEERAKALGFKPRALIKDVCYVGIDPFDMLLIGPAVAVPLLLKRNKMTLKDVDRFEIHEAFAAQVLSCLKMMDSKEFCAKHFGDSKAFGRIPDDRLNVNGGAIALGHPLGASGTRLVISMVNELERSGGTHGVLALCTAGGMAISMLIERLG